MTSKEVAADSDSPRADRGSAEAGNSRPAGRSAGAIALFVAVACLALASDLLSKHFAFDSLLSDPELIARAERVRGDLPPDGLWKSPEEKTKYVLHEFQRGPLCGVKFTLSVNPGVVFGWRLPRLAVAFATVITIGLVCAFFATSERKARLTHLALAFILAGALGNLYDRLFSYVSPLGMEPIRRNVRDFIDCADLYYPWVFNIADVLLVVGVILLALQWFRTYKADEASGKQAQSGPDTV